MEALLLTTIWFAERDALPSVEECRRQRDYCDQQLNHILKWDEARDIRLLYDWWDTASLVKCGDYVPSCDDPRMQWMQQTLGEGRWWARNWPYATPPSSPGSE